jgi:hypothetical protein
MLTGVSVFKIVIKRTFISFPVIVSKPRSSTLVSFSFFLFLTLAVLGMNVFAVLKSAAWYNYLIILLLIPLTLFVTFRIFIRYKVIRMGNQKIEIKYPVLGQLKQYPLDQVRLWKESIVRTGKNSVFKELEIRFSDSRKVTIGDKEHTDYDRMVRYLNQKAPKKKEL